MHAAPAWMKHFVRPAVRRPRCLQQLNPVRQLNVANEAGNEEDCEIPLTREGAISYLRDVLEIPDPVGSLQECRTNFLHQFQRRTKMTQPFTNITYSDADGPASAGPAHTKRTMLAKQGGGCTQLNHFSAAVLNRMGFKTRTVGGALTKGRSGMYQSHYSFIVQDSDGNSQYLVDTGTVHPVLDMTPLDFERVSPTYQLASYPVRLFRECPGVIKLCIQAANDGATKGDPNIYSEDGRLWRPALTYHINQPLSWKHAYKLANAIATNSFLFPDIHKNMLVFGFSRGLWTVIKGRLFAQYKEGRETTSRRLESDEAVMATIQDHFPQYYEEDLQNFMKLVEKARGLLG